MKRIALLLLCFCLSACGYRGLGGSFVGTLPDAAATQAIASDAIAFLSERYAPGHTTLFLLTPEKDANNAFSAQLEAGLRQRGFSVTAERASDAITVAYTLDSLKGDEGEDDAAWYLQLRLSDGQAYARAYTAAGSPEAGRSATTLSKGFGSSVYEKASDKVGETIQ